MRLVVLAGAAGSALVLAAPPTTAAVHTLVTTRHPITALAHDGDRIAWLTIWEKGGCGAVRVRTVPDGKIVGLRRPCGSQTPAPPLVLAGGRALWTAYGGGNTPDWTYKTAAVRDRTIRTLGWFERSVGWTTDLVAYGDWTSVAGDGRTLAFARVITHDPDEDFSPPFPVEGGGASRVLAGAASTIPDVPPVDLLAASAGRIAVLPAGPYQLEPSSPPPPAPGAAVEIRSTETGAIVTSLAVDGTVLEVALSGRQAAVLAADDEGGRWIERRDAVTGELLDTAAVAAEARALDVAGTRVLFRVGKSIRLFDGATDTTRTIRTTKRWPIGVTIEGRRVVWAVNKGGRGRVLSLVLPPAA